MKYMLQITYRDTNQLGNQHKVKYLYFKHTSGMGSVVNFADMLAQEYVKNPRKNTKRVQFSLSDMSKLDLSNCIPVEIDGNFNGILPGSMFKSATLFEWQNDDQAFNAWGHPTGGKWIKVTNII